MSRKVIMVSVNVPFPGFYESTLSHDLDSAEEMMTSDDSNEANAELEQPELLRLDSNDLAECLFDAMDYGAAHGAMARDYAEAFDSLAGELLGFGRKMRRRVFNAKTGKITATGGEYVQPTIRAEYEEMTSPREYNFGTDRLFMQVPLVIMRQLFKRSAANEHSTLRTCIEERFTSRSGFSSFYTTDLDSWLAKPLAQWDHNELGTLLIAALEDAGVNDDADSYYETLAGRIAEDMNESAYSAVDQACDWPKYEAAKQAKRETLLEEWREVDPQAVAAFLGEGEAASDGHGLLMVRDPATADLFDAAL